MFRNLGAGRKHRISLRIIDHMIRAHGGGLANTFGLLNSRSRGQAGINIRTWVYELAIVFRMQSITDGSMAGAACWALAMSFWVNVLLEVPISATITSLLIPAEDIALTSSTVSGWGAGCAGAAGVDEPPGVVGAVGFS